MPALILGAPVRTMEHGRELGWWNNICWGSPSDHCTRSSFFSACSCDQGFTGKCCDVPLICSPSMNILCPQNMMKLKNASVADFGDKDKTPMRIGKAPLPPQLRGVYWLSDQGDSSSLVSFAQSNDGDGLSPGAMPADGKYKVRVIGDKVWSFADRSFNWEASQVMDIIYEFDFDEDITEARVWAGGGNKASIIWTGVTYAVNFGMKLRTEPHPRYTNSVVWDRPSSFLGNVLSSYEVIQVMDEDGNKLEPAFSDWVRYNNQAETGETPGIIYYFEATPGQV